MRLIIVRHGQTEFNLKGFVQGQSDVPLNDTGKEQAQRVALKLQNEKINIAFSSDLPRALETAEAIMKYHPNVKLQLSELLREVKAGELEGTKKSDDDRKINWTQYYKAKDGESFFEGQERMIKFYKEILEKHLGETVLLVSHGGVMGSFFIHLLGKDLIWENYVDLRHKNCAYSIVEIDEDLIHKVIVYNETSHLEELDIDTAGNL
tara:strand:- start:6818 stop:7438 length:621 start_codon:yes stop_codon:yes gene_type:complete